MNFKSYSKSHKLKKRIPTTKEQQAIFFNTHEAIVKDAVFERVQEFWSCLELLPSNRKHFNMRAYLILKNNVWMHEFFGVFLLFIDLSPRSAAYSNPTVIDITNNKFDHYLFIFLNIKNFNIL